MEEVEKLVERLRKLTCEANPIALAREAAATLERVEKSRAWETQEADLWSKRAHAAQAQVEALRKENADLKSSVIAFCAPWAVSYARDHGLQPGQLFATHYDILERCGGRMVDFVRIGPRAAALSDLAAQDADLICGPAEAEESAVYPEPAAWQGRSEPGRSWEPIEDAEYFRGCGWEVRPLYALPTPPKA